MLYHRSVILDTRGSQRFLQAPESEDLLEIQYMRQGLISHVDISDHRWQVAFPIHIPPVHFEKPFRGYFTSNTAIQIKAFIDDLE